MAVNKLKIIRSRLDSRIAYILNPDKTDGGLLTGGVQCTPFTAYADMQETKKRFGKTDGRLAYHLIQSYKEGEITAADAMKMSERFIEKHLGDAYETVYSVHEDHAHIHLHIIWNTVSYRNGMKYHAGNGQYLDKIRRQSDELCREFGYSVIENDGKHPMKGQHYAAWKAEQEGKDTWRTIIRRDMDNVIAESFNYAHFLHCMERRGYEFKQGKHLAVRAPRQERFIRLKSLGDGYFVENIRNRIERNEELTRRKTFLPKPVPKYMTGIRALYWQYLYRMGMVRKGQYSGKPSGALYADILKFDRIVAEFKLLDREKIGTMEQLREFNVLLEDKMKTLTVEKQQLHLQQKLAPDEEQTNISARVADAKAKLCQIKKELRMVNTIGERSVCVAELITGIEKNELKREERTRERRER